MAKKKRATFKKARKSKVGRGKPKGKPPAALRAPAKKKRRKAERIAAPTPREVGLLDVIGVCE